MKPPQSRSESCLLDIAADFKSFTVQDLLLLTDLSADTITEALHNLQLSQLLDEDYSETGVICYGWKHEPLFLPQLGM